MENPWSLADQPIRTRILDLTLISGIALVGRLGYWLMKGTKVGMDTPTYTSTCDVWLSAPLTFPRPQNSGFTVPFCLVTEVLNFHWDAWIALQIAFSIGACYLVYEIATNHLDRTAGIVAGISMAVLWDSFQWTIYILTDAVFVVFVTFALWAVSRYDEARNQRRLVVSWIALLLTIFTRPYGLPIVLGWLVYDLLPRDNRYRFEIIPHPYIGIVFGILSFIFVLSQYPTFLTDKIIALWADGQLVHDAPSFTYDYIYITDPSALEFVVFNLPQMLLVSLLRVLLFFVPVLPRWSTIHNIVNLFTLVPMFLASLVAVVDLWRRDRRLLRLWTMPLVMILLVVAVTFVDWDWRYRAPAAPVFSLLTGYTASRLHARIVKSEWEPGLFLIGYLP